MDAAWEAFVADVARLTASEDWKALERRYRLMLHELATAPETTVAGRAKVDVEHDTWLALGRVYRDRLADPAAASETLALSARYRPTDLEIRFELASVLEEAKIFDRARATYEEILRIDPRSMQAYARLFDLVLDRRELDAAWCVASVRALFGAAGGLDEAGRELYEDYRPRRAGTLAGRLDDAAWNRLRCGGDRNDFDLNRALRLVAPPAPPWSSPHPALVSSGALAWASAALGTAGADASALDPGQDLDSDHGGSTLREVLFIAGSEVAFQRDPVISALARSHTPHDLSVLLLGAMKMTNPARELPADRADAATAKAAELERALDPDRKRLVASALSEVGAVKLGQWKLAVLSTAARAGLLVAGDMRAAKNVLYADHAKDEPVRNSLMVDLCAFAVSAAHLELRARLGRSVATNADAEPGRR